VTVFWVEGFLLRSGVFAEEGLAVVLVFPTFMSIPGAQFGARPPEGEEADVWWSRQGSNLRPSHCERDALPTELRPRTKTRITMSQKFWQASGSFFRRKRETRECRISRISTLTGAVAAESPVRSRFVVGISPGVRRPIAAPSPGVRRLLAAGCNDCD
jgi:hypothetical protein